MKFHGRTIAIEEKSYIFAPLIIKTIKISRFICTGHLN